MTENVELGSVQETLLIPLAARAIASSQYPELDFRDQAAAKALDQLHADVDRFTSDDSSMKGCLLRAKWFDGVVRNFLNQHPDGLCVSLGSGLDNRALRIGIDRFPDAQWVDVDLPDVTKLRQQVFANHPQVQTVTHDITEADWLEALPWAEGRPVVFLSEGVFMYLAPSLGEKLITAIGREADKKSAYVELAFDYSSPLMVKFSHKHPTVSKTQAVFQWGIKRPRDLIRLDPRLELIEHSDFAMQMNKGVIFIKLLYGALTFGRRFYGLMHFRRGIKT